MDMSVPERKHIEQGEKGDPTCPESLFQHRPCAPSDSKRKDSSSATEKMYIQINGSHATANQKEHAKRVDKKLT